MTRDDIIRMAREAGAATGSPAPGVPEIIFPQCMDVERFAALVRDYLLSTEIHSCHANCQRFACVQTRKAVEAEREACAKVCDELAEKDKLSNYYSVAARAIRARSKQ